MPDDRSPLLLKRMRLEDIGLTFDVPLACMCPPSTGENEYLET